MIYNGLMDFDFVLSFLLLNCLTDYQTVVKAIRYSGKLDYALRCMVRKPVI